MTAAARPAPTTFYREIDRNRRRSWLLVGAVVAVLGALAVIFPHARVTTLVIFFFITVVQIPAVFVLVGWFVLQLFSVVGQLGIDVGGGVAYWAHIGGFVFGAIVAWLFYRRPHIGTPEVYPAGRPDYF